MESLLQELFASAALALEAIACIILVIGAAGAVWDTAKGLVTDPDFDWRRTLWLRFAAWIVLALEFALAADIVKTLLSPTWDELGKLAVVAVLRTVLSFFVWRDLEEVESVPTLQQNAVAEELSVPTKS